jgi:hypothetical protein
MSSGTSNPVRGARGSRSALCGAPLRARGRALLAWGPRRRPPRPRRPPAGAAGRGRSQARSPACTAAPGGRPPATPGRWSPSRRPTRQRPRPGPGWRGSALGRSRPTSAPEPPGSAACSWGVAAPPSPGGERALARGSGDLYPRGHGSAAPVGVGSPPMRGAEGPGMGQARSPGACPRTGELLRSPGWCTRMDRARRCAWPAPLGRRP